MRTVVIIPNLKKDSSLTVTEKVAKKLRSLGMRVLLDEKYKE